MCYEDNCNKEQYCLVCGRYHHPKNLCWGKIKQRGLFRNENNNKDT